MLEGLGAFVAKLLVEIGRDEDVQEGDHPEDAGVQTREGPQELCPENTVLYFEIAIVGLFT